MNTSDLPRPQPSSLFFPTDEKNLKLFDLDFDPNLIHKKESD